MNARIRFRSLALGLVAVLAGGTAIAQPASAEDPDPAFISDDFASGTLNTGLWTVTDPAGEGGVSVANGRLKLSVPSGKNYDIWGTNRALRATQAVADSDFQAEVRFTTVPTQKYQTQGILVEQNATNWLRFDVYSTGSALRVFAAKTINGSSTQLLQSNISAGPEVQLRLTREGDSWTLAYSTNGTTWVNTTTVTHPLQANRIGPFASNGSPYPAFTAEVDWFIDTAAPDPGDPGDPGDPDPTFTLDTVTSGQGSITRSPNQQSYPAGATVTLTAQPSDGWEFSSWSGDASGTAASIDVTVDSNKTVNATFIEAQAEPPGEAAFVSDDFASGSLNTGLWAITDPAGKGNATVNDGRLRLSVPSGTNYDIWGTNRALRVTQPVADTDFQAEVRFTSVPSQKYQTQGILVEQNATNWLRFDVHSTGSALRVYGARTVNGASAQLFSKTISASSQVLLRLERTNDSWALSYSTNGTTWTSAGTADHVLQASRIGPFASNGSPYPAFTAEIDYFVDLANTDPGDPEPNPEYSLTTNAVGQGTISKSPNQTSYAAGTVVTLTAQAASGWQFAGWSGAASGTNTTTDVTMDGNKSVTATFSQAQSNPPVIDVWYGDDQIFGARGQSQKWVNILGNVSDGDGVQSLTYRLNGGSPVTLQRGPDLRRLYGTGDFNVEILYSNLNNGANTVAITAVDTTGATTTKSVTVRKDIQAATLPHNVSWGSSTNPNHTAQVVDGKWTSSSNGLTVTEMGYDRTVAVGHTGWENYEVTVPVTVRELGPGAGTPQSGAPLVGLGLHWQGHTTVGSEQPARGWYPTGAFAWHRWQQGGRFELIGNDGSPLTRKNTGWDFNTTYVMKARVESVSGGYRYSYKWWPQDSTEPAAWGLTLVEDDGPATGSVLLIAHHVDATFGDVVVSPL
ncbi:DUF1349 domain-containing protein [Phytoactinopolyspora alkaliphila]|uniref:DUF1349 domain-containing protein n=1 Tax=Phytoactinopolyspora alkaliphila TaxID=1783498 RepID=A0A6N9YJH1_9ACTN|nr:DUF1349 domain-containing protein [Phytoactinopolyspora alkaliphila]NED95097.1 DUF1349 domain-containing protein [Phytoactinopolyspora alkaliphila]